MADPIRTFRHFREVPDSFWRWKNFSPAEIACRGTGQLKLHPSGNFDINRDIPLRTGMRCLHGQLYGSAGSWLSLLDLEEHRVLN